MDLINITAIDKHTSRYCGESMYTNILRESLEEFISKLDYHRYELICQDNIDLYSDEVKDILDEFNVGY